MSPLKRYWSLYMVPVPLFGDRVFMEVIKMRLLYKDA